MPTFAYAQWCGEWPDFPIWLLMMCLGSPMALSLFKCTVSSVSCKYQMNLRSYRWPSRLFNCRNGWKWVCVSPCASVFVWVCVYVCACACVSVCECVSVCAWVCVCVLLSTCMHASQHVLVEPWVKEEKESLIIHLLAWVCAKCSGTFYSDTSHLNAICRHSQSLCNKL